MDLTMDLTELQIIELDLFLAFPDREDAIRLAEYKKNTGEVEFYSYVLDCLRGKKIMKEVYKCKEYHRLRDILCISINEGQT